MKLSHCGLLSSVQVVATDINTSWCDYVDAPDENMLHLVDVKTKPKP